VKRSELLHFLLVSEMHLVLLQREGRLQLVLQDLLFLKDMILSYNKAHRSCHGTKPVA
jgi:hypothetical protein